MKLKVALAQMCVEPASPDVNLKRAETFIAEAARQGSNLICMPEMWTTGFDWDYIDSLYMEQEPIIGKVAALAVKYGIWINGSLLSTNAQGRPVNTSILIDSSGAKRAVYHKIHLFSPIQEDKHLAAGDSLSIAETDWGKIGLSICYDLRFPELFRSYALQGANVIILNAAFPCQRIGHFKTLIRARAIENQIFIVALNRTGFEAGMEFCGSSAIIDPFGDVLVEAPENSEALLAVQMDMDRLEEVRSKIKILSDRRPEVYNLR